MKIGIYCRVSTEEQKTKGISIIDQEERGIQFCLKNKYEYEVFNDSGLSGELSPENRPELNKLIEKIYLKEIDGVFVVDFDRLSRDEKFGFVFKKILTDNQIKLFDLSGELNLEDESQDLLLGIKILLSSFEIKKLKVRIKRSLERSVINGRVNGGLIPYGYTKGEDKQLIIDEVESKVVKLIYQLSIQGKGTKVISNYLNDNNIPTKRNNVLNGHLLVKGVRKTEFKWRDSVIYNILTNTIYIGERKFKGNIYPSPIIIEKEKFNLVQELLKTRKNLKDTSNVYFYLLKGLLFCKCGNRLYGHRSINLSKKNYYGCSSSRHKNEGCGTTKGINIDYLDDLILKNVLNIEDDVNEFFSWYETSDINVYLNDLLTKTIKEEELFKQKINNLIELGLDGNIEKSIFNTKMEELNNKLKEIKETKLKYLKELTLNEKKDDIKKVIKELVNKIKVENDLYIKREYIRGIIDRIDINWEEEEQRHIIRLSYKIDELTEYRLERDLEINYQKSGFILNRDKEIKNKLVIKKFLSNNNTILENPSVKVI